MANVKVTDLTAYTDPINTDVLPIVDVTTDTTKKVTFQNLLKTLLAKAGGTMTGTITFAAGQTFPTTGIAAASTSQSGIVQLTDSTSSTSTTTAATPNAVKTTYDLANAALPKSGGTITGNINNTATGYLDLPVGTTAQRPTGANGKVRYNSTTASYEGYNGSAWSSLGGGATGAGGDTVFNLNSLEVTTSYTLPTGKSAMSVGAITINSGVTVTVPSGQRWVIL